jgi:5-methyltetrahydrofolate--homocysteine methyltransferase
MCRRTVPEGGAAKRSTPFLEPMDRLIQSLLDRQPVITDGAWGTQLQINGLRPGECPDAWNLTCPSVVEEIARSYVAAGSRIILTNTFGASRIALARHGLADRAAEINRTGAILSVGAAGQQAYVFGSIGPSGKLLLTEEVGKEELSFAFTEQAMELRAGGVQGIVIETMSDLAEARIAVEAAKSTGLPVAACMVFDSGPDNDRTMMGTTPEEAAGELASAGAEVIGANCGAGIEGYIPICRRLHAATPLPIWIKPNAGLPALLDGKITYSMTAEEFARHAQALRDAGASFIGGCCGTGPAFIRTLVRTLAPDA